MADKLTEGWGYMSNAVKGHYFKSNRSLCGRWIFFGELDADDGVARQSDCLSCRKKNGGSKWLTRNTSTLKDLILT